MNSQRSNKHQIRAARPVKRPWIALALAACLSHGMAMADSEETQNPAEPSADAQGNISEKIRHRLADWVNTISPFGILQNRASVNQPPTGDALTAPAPITYHGGPIMASVSKVVVIWYGNWAQANGTDNAAGQQILRDMLYGLAAAPLSTTTNYAGITTGVQSTLGTYTQTSKARVSALSSATLTEFTQAASATYGGNVLTDASVLSLVKAKAGTSADANAIYLVLSSSEINESSGFLTSYCGWHSFGSAGGKTVKYAFIGNPNRNLAACSYQTTASPNGNPGVDAMASVIAHELEEIVTDPQLNAWYDINRQENGDICAWTFGSNQQLAPNNNGSYYNVTLPTKTGTRNYLLQRALASSDSKCYINATGKVQ